MFLPIIHFHFIKLVTRHININIHNYIYITWQKDVFTNHYMTFSLVSEGQYAFIIHLWMIISCQNVCLHSHKAFVLLLKLSGCPISTMNCKFVYL